jgi:hypothetical protein
MAGAPFSGSDRAAREEQLMAEFAVEFPGWEVERVWGVGFVAFPKGTPVLRSITIDAMKAKLERQRDGKAGETETEGSRNG